MSGAAGGKVVRGCRGPDGRKDEGEEISAHGGKGGTFFT